MTDLRTAGGTDLLTGVGARVVRFPNQLASQVRRGTYLVPEMLLHLRNYVDHGS